MTVKTLGVVSLGCSKNLVDTEMMVGILEKDGYKMVDDLDDAQVIFVNTCTFIDAAKEESIQTILQAAEYKKVGHLRKIGCGRLSCTAIQEEPQR